MKQKVSDTEERYYEKRLYHIMDCSYFGGYVNLECEQGDEGRYSNQSKQ